MSSAQRKEPLPLSDGLAPGIDHRAERLRAGGDHALHPAVAAFSFIRSGAAWNEIGKGRFASALMPRRASPSRRTARPAIQAAEVRQMLEAKSYRR